MKKLFLYTAITVLSVSCAKPEYYARMVKREATCKFMREHPIKDTINNSLYWSYRKQYHAGLYVDEMAKCGCDTSKTMIFQ